jgi:hypothetical protein
MAWRGSGVRVPSAPPKQQVTGHVGVLIGGARHGPGTFVDHLSVLHSPGGHPDGRVSSRLGGLSEDDVDAITPSDSFGPLASELRRAEAEDHGIAKLLPRILAQRSLDGADDIGAVLTSRLRQATSGSRRTKPGGGRLVAGHVPVPDGRRADDMSQALVERQELMEARAAAPARSGGLSTSTVGEATRGTTRRTAGA